MGRHGAPAGPRAQPPPRPSTTPTGRHRHAAPRAAVRTPRAPAAAPPRPPVIATPVPPPAPGPPPFPVPQSTATDRALRETAAWSTFAVAVLWGMIMASGRGVFSATAWAGSLLGLVWAALLVLAWTGRPRRTPDGNRARED